jgi:6-pyruvoyltetrahydropterin/6-carboxytetrahydropterin synthase
MYKIEKRFTLPIGHRLSKHQGRCFSLHGHNFTILVGVKCKFLNENDMVMDFSDLNQMTKKFLDTLDHSTMLNRLNDTDIAEKLKEIGTRIQLVDYDPTAEKLAELVYKEIESSLAQLHSLVKMDYVTVYENEKSKATYLEE